MGAHRLIQDGAALIQGWEDVVGQLPLRWRDSSDRPMETDDGRDMANAGCSADQSAPTVNMPRGMLRMNDTGLFCD